MFDSHQKGTIGITFSNGTRVSIVWKPGTYSDNHDAIFDDPTKGGRFNEERLMGLDREPCVSKTAEVMITDDPTGLMAVYLKNHHDGQNPVGYLTLNEVMELLYFAWQSSYPKPTRSKK